MVLDKYTVVYAVCFLMMSAQVIFVCPATHAKGPRGFVVVKGRDRAVGP